MKKTITIFSKVENQEDYKFVEMSKEDIILNACIFYADEVSGKMLPMVIDEVLNEGDEFKAFSANGCRLGTDGFYVMRYY